MKRLALALFLVLSLVLPVYASRGGSTPRSHSSQRSYSSHSHSSHSHSSSPRVHVRGYTKRNGTYVTPHTRRNGGSHSSTGRSYSHHSTSTATHHRSYTSTSTSTRDSHGRIKRSETAKHKFERQTGFPHGRPGYVIDHVVPLCRGGADAPSNMQWQTVAAAKAKDKTECH